MTYIVLRVEIQIRSRKWDGDAKFSYMSDHVRIIAGWMPGFWSRLLNFGLDDIFCSTIAIFLAQHEVFETVWALFFLRWMLLGIHGNCCQCVRADSSPSSLRTRLLTIKPQFKLCVWYSSFPSSLTFIYLLWRSSIFNVHPSNLSCHSLSLESLLVALL